MVIFKPLSLNVPSAYAMDRWTGARIQGTNDANKISSRTPPPQRKGSRFFAWPERLATESTTPRQRKDRVGCFLTRLEPATSWSIVKGLCHRDMPSRFPRRPVQGGRTKQKKWSRLYFTTIEFSTTWEAPVGHRLGLIITCITKDATEKKIKCWMKTSAKLHIQLHFTSRS